MIPVQGLEDPASPGGLHIRELSKTYPGGVLANDSLSLTIHPDEVFGLLGPNGAGSCSSVREPSLDWGFSSKRSPGARHSTSLREVRSSRCS
jgi:hypothetical protein